MRSKGREKKPKPSSSSFRNVSSIRHCMPCSLVAYFPYFLSPWKWWFNARASAKWWLWKSKQKGTIIIRYEILKKHLPIDSVFCLLFILIMCSTKVVNSISKIDTVDRLPIALQSNWQSCKLTSIQCTERCRTRNKKCHAPCRFSSGFPTRRTKKNCYQHYATSSEL